MRAVESCPECRSPLVDDMQMGEIVCSGCGVVVDDHVADMGPENAGSTLEDKMRLARATGSTTYAQHDLGIATGISQSNKDFSGRSINGGMTGQMHSLRKWQKRIRVQSPEDRRLVSVLEKMNESCQALGLPRTVLETASVIYRKLDPEKVKGRMVVSMVTATVHMACKECGVVRSLDEICRSMCEPKEAAQRKKLAARYYRDLLIPSREGREPAPAIPMDRIISMIANKTETDPRVERLALEIAEKTRDSSITDGKVPNGIAAAYLYVASVLLGQGILQRDASAEAGVTEVTIRNRCKEILTCHRLRITLRPSLAGR
ncbi:MAG: transcription factor IIB [Nitrosopumilus sp.]|nr:transcription factor IIB [Nitrosopumilus sp.]CAI9831840.1 Transcription initiation factor IIB [Nitrosopumilaceae archaeon]MDA7941658.1 transcription factor IIB [Nitrosopumilus sp.]MDA7943767.1 transcription factor IIB [Nitrosopumilus sp.]MDA7945131.1 transcription factor IIB [Nitrosopumilus sp.]